MPKHREASSTRPALAICRAIERIEAESAYSQHRCAPAAEERRMGLFSERIAGTTLVLTRRSSNRYYNRWIAPGQSSAATQVQLDRVIEAARAHGVTSLGVDLGPVSRPTALPEWLESRGFERGHPGAKLWRDASPLRRAGTSPGVRVRRVQASEASLWVDVVSRVWRTFGFRRPWFEARAQTVGWTHYLAWVGDEPVGAGALFVGKAGSRVGAHLVDGVTLAPWRRRGVQRAIIRRRVSDALRMGAQVMTSETAPPLPRMPLVSYRNLLRQGFRLAYLRDSWRVELP